jgi:hypothetical protein
MKPDMISEYITAFGMHCVVIASLGDRRFAGHGADPLAAAKSIAAAIGRKFICVDEIWWCGSAVGAYRLAGTISRQAGGDVPSIARGLGLAVVADEVLKRRAAEAVTVAERELTEMQRNGGLRAINQAYRMMRLQNEARGENTPPYAVYLTAEKARIIRTVAAGVRASPHR